MPSARTPRPFRPTMGQTGARRLLWLLPTVMAAVFVLVFAEWAHTNDQTEHLTHISTQTADAQSVNAQLLARKYAEEVHLADAALSLSTSHEEPELRLRRSPTIVAGLERLWTQVTWLDTNSRILASETRNAAHGDAAPVPAETIEAHSPATGSQRSQKDFLSAVLRDASGRGQGTLIADYLIADLLRGTDLNWLNDRYQVEFVSNSLEEVIATTASASRTAEGLSFRKSLDAFEDTTLVLTPFNAEAVWYRNQRTLALLSGMVGLGIAASLWLKREMRQVHRAIARAQTESAWRQSMEDSALVGLRARDPQGRLLYVNKTLCDMVGYSRDAVVGLAPPLPFWPADAVDDMMARNLRTLAGDVPVAGFESRWQHRDGHLIDVMIFESRLMDTTGKHIGWMGSIVDISERKRLEEKDRKQMEAMAQHARLNDMGLIASELAHELNQPLTAIVSYSAGLGMAMKKQTSPDAELVEVAEEIHKSAQKAGDIVNWIRRQSSRVEPDRKLCDLQALVSDAVALRKRHLQRNGVNLQLDLGPPVHVLADRVAIEQVISNLLRNAVDAMAETDGKRRLSVSTQCIPAYQDKPASVELSVTDSGPGLQGRTLDMLCATFFSTKPEGMGLGLGICRAIIEAHGGTLTAEDARDGGARFAFSLPTVDPSVLPEGA